MFAILQRYSQQLTFSFEAGGICIAEPREELLRRLVTVCNFCAVQENTNVADRQGRVAAEVLVAQSSAQVHEAETRFNCNMVLPFDSIHSHESFQTVCCPSLRCARWLGTIECLFCLGAVDEDYRDLDANAYVIVGRLVRPTGIAVTKL